MSNEEIVNLKAQAYDCLATIEFNRNRLNQINQQIAALMNQPAPMPEPAE